MCLVTLIAIIYLHEWGWMVVVVVVVVSVKVLLWKLQMESWTLWMDMERNRKAPGEKAVIFAQKNRQIREQRRSHWRSAFNGN